ncbi:MAG: DISARM system SNF2-like helicase DrmD [Acidobacteriota bacterium]
MGLPEQGQLVDVRQRRFVVTEVRKTSLPANPMLAGNSTSQHLVSLSSVEDDALGEELQVIWELEPGACAYEKMELPTPIGFDEPARLDAFLDAVRWGASSSADVRNIQSPFRSGIDIEDYQLDPVVRAIQMPRVNLLIADDVGLGKTIEAGLVAQELILRHRARHILIVCPSSLQIQWQEQMRDKFGLDFRIVDSSMMKELRRRRGIHVNPWTHFPRLITSIDFIKRERPLRLFREVLPSEGELLYPRRFDLLIVDECHNVAPAGGGNYAIDSLRTAAIRMLAPHFEHKLFLTATPHNGYPESFTALLELLDSQRFARGVPPDRNQLQTVMVRRLKRELQDWDGSPRFPERKLAAISVVYTDEERRAHAALKKYTECRTKDLEDQTERYATEFVLKLLKKRLFSSPRAFANTLAQHEHSLKTAQRRSSSVYHKPTIGILRRQLEQIEEEFADDEAYDLATEDVIAATAPLFRELTAEEEGLLKEMQEWAEKASARPDSKAKELLNWLYTYIKPNKQWSNERVLIFTEYRATQKWLLQLLVNEGFAETERLMTLYGGMDAKEREKVKAAFQAGPDISNVRILLATDAASEGLDLQNHCSKLIHYEIPWNPNRMEQRNGRIDRHGQKAKEVLIYHFIGTGYKETDLVGTPPGELDGDLEFLMRAALKVNTIREDLMGKVGQVIADQVEEAMLGRRSRLDTEATERESEPVRRMLKFERKVKEQIEKLNEQLQETRKNLRLSPDNTLSVVKIGLELAGQPTLTEVEVPDLNGKAYCLPPMKGSWGLCLEGIEHPHTHEPRSVVFDPELSKGRDDVVLIHLNHRLVQMCLRLLRAEVWQRAETKNLHRVTALVVLDSALELPAVIVYGRLVVLGSDQQRLHEEVITAGGILKEGSFRRLSPMQIQNALVSTLPEPVPESLKKRLVERWPTYHAQLLQSLQVRVQDSSERIEKKLQERANKEVDDVSKILMELRESILRELKESEQENQQMKLFSDMETEQFKRNIASLKARVEQIPREIVQETSAIISRYADPTARLFPLAITYLIPQKIARGRK